MNDIPKNLNDSSIAKAWLIDFRDKEEDIQNLFNRLDVIEMRITSIRSPSLSDMPKSPAPFQDRSAFLVGVKVDLENEISECQKEQYQMRKNIEKVIKKLKKAEQRSVIRARYLDCSFYHEDKLCDWNDVTNTLFGDMEDFLDKEDSYLRRVHKIHANALTNMARYLEEHPEAYTPYI